MKILKILSWYKSNDECGFRVITNCGKYIFVEDYPSSFNIQIDKYMNDIELHNIQFSKDHQFNVDEKDKIPNKLDYERIFFCTIKGSENDVKNLLQSIGWSNINKQHVYKSPLTENLIEEMQRIQSYMEETVNDFKKLKEEV